MFNAGDEQNRQVGYLAVDSLDDNLRRVAGCEHKVRVVNAMGCAIRHSDDEWTKGRCLEKLSDARFHCVNLSFVFL
jgi:hypothetical protein